MKSELKPKYRLLSKEELTELEEEFVHFLVVNGMAAEDWEKLKKEDSDTANQFVTLFSDVILEGSLRKIEFIEWRSTHELRVFKCGEEVIELVGLTVEKNATINLLENDLFKESSSEMPEGISAYQTEKKYSKIREMEIFELIQAGCMIVNGELFNLIRHFINSTNKEQEI